MVLDYDDRPGSALSTSSGSTENQDMWSSMLSSVASSKRLPQKSILALGGTHECQKEFVESLNLGGKKGEKKAPLANAFALGYTYLDVLDAEHEDVVARLGLYMLAEPDPAFIPLLRTLFTPSQLPDTMICILLDWRKPWAWMRQLRTWVRLLSTVFKSLDGEAKRTLEELTQNWQTRRSTYSDAGGGGTEVVIPLGPGEFDEPLGLPICVIAQHADKIETLEREKAWKDGEFDFVLQFLRTVLLKHGASLIYTIPNVPSSLSPLLFSLLSIPIPDRNQTIKHNIIDRDKVLVPPGWDSWGKIRVLGENFDADGICGGWSVDISPGFVNLNDDVEGGAVEIYEEVVEDKAGPVDALGVHLKQRGIEIPMVDTQEFLSAQMEVLASREEGEVLTRGGGAGASGVLSRTGTGLSGAGGAAMGIPGSGAGGAATMGAAQAGDRTADMIMMRSSHERNTSKTLPEGGVRDHVGPVQFNVGGIQMDAEDMMAKGQKAREASRGAGSEREHATPQGSPAETKTQTEVLSAFFTSLITRGDGARGAKNSPS